MGLKKKKSTKSLRLEDAFFGLLELEADPAEGPQLSKKETKKRKKWK